MKIAIIGAGNVGKALAGSATRAGNSVTVSSTTGDSARAAAEQTGARPAASSRAAVEEADLVILAVPYSAVDDVLASVGDAIAGKVVVDATNPIKPDYSGLATGERSGAEEIQAQGAGRPRREGVQHRVRRPAGRPQSGRRSARRRLRGRR